MSDCVVKEHVKIIALKESKLIYSVVGMRMIFSLGALAYWRYIYVYFYCIFVIPLTLAFLFLCAHQRSHSIR